MASPKTEEVRERIVTSVRLNGSVTIFGKAARKHIRVLEREGRVKAAWITSDSDYGAVLTLK